MLTLVPWWKWEMINCLEPCSLAKISNPNTVRYMNIWWCLHKAQQLLRCYFWKSEVPNTLIKPQISSKVWSTGSHSRRSYDKLTFRLYRRPMHASIHHWLISVVQYVRCQSELSRSSTAYILYVLSQSSEWKAAFSTVVGLHEDPTKVIHTTLAEVVKPKPRNVVKKLWASGDVGKN